MSSPLVFTWTGEAMEILPRFAKEADRRFVIGQRYVMDEIHERSAKSHAHYFACVSRGWSSLPEAIGAQFATADHLRRYCLIKGGFHNHRSIVARSRAEALKIAGFVRPMDEFAVVTVNECVVDVFTARSQNHRSMNRQEFQASKTAVLEIIDDMLGVPRGATEGAEMAA